MAVVADPQGAPSARTSSLGQKALRLCVETRRDSAHKPRASTAFAVRVLRLADPTGQRFARRLSEQLAILARESTEMAEAQPSRYVCHMRRCRCRA